MYIYVYICIYICSHALSIGRGRTHYAALPRPPGGRGDRCQNGRAHPPQSSWLCWSAAEHAISSRMAASRQARMTFCLSCCRRPLRPHQLHCSPLLSLSSPQRGLHGLDGGQSPDPRPPDSIRVASRSRALLGGLDAWLALGRLFCGRKGGHVAPLLSLRAWMRSISIIMLRRPWMLVSWRRCGLISRLISGTRRVRDMSSDGARRRRWRMLGSASRRCWGLSLAR